MEGLLMKVCSILCALFLLFAMTGCQKIEPIDTVETTETPEMAETTETAEYFPTDGFKCSTPEAQGMDSAKLSEMFEEINQKDLDIHHVMIIRNGYIVAQCDFYPYAHDQLHLLNSVTKSVMSAAIGIAIDEGVITSIEDPVLDYFPDQTFENPSDFKSRLTIKNLLTMTAGFDWSEDGNYGAPYDSWTQMKQSDNAINYIMNKPVTTEPGKTFYYNTGASYLLSALITQKTGKPASEYVFEKIFQPIGIKDYYWLIDNQGISFGGSALLLRTEDLAKFGYLYLNNGKWGNQQIIPEAYVKESTALSIETPNGLAGHSGYGYHWWMNSSEGYSGRGFRGQYLFVVPEENIVVVFYSGLANKDYFAPETFLSTYILGAIQSDEAIADNPEGYSKLQELIAFNERAPEAAALQPLPEIAKEISGTVFSVENGQTVCMDFQEGQAEAMLHWFVDGVQYDVPVGLDQVGRISDCQDFIAPGLITPVAFTGTWESEDTFEIYMQPLHGDASYTLVLKYKEHGLETSFITN
jgi:CubicO group peptidase (beta-lactamase class C family)